MINRIAIFIPVLVVAAFSQELPQGHYFEYYLDNATVDTSLDPGIRDSFQDDDGSIPLKSISVDLNDDGIFEKIIPNEFLCGTGGCPWLIYNQKSKTIIGKLDGKVIYINSNIANGYYTIETYWRMGGGEGDVSYYECLKDKYLFVKKAKLHGNQIDGYFDNKKVLRNKKK